MLVRIKQPIKGYGYFGGETVNLPSEKATELVENGFAILVQETEGDANTLPEKLPLRELLFENGYETVEQILQVRNTLVDVKGIGKALSLKIIEFCESYEN